MFAADCWVQVAPPSVLTKNPAGSGAPPVPCMEAYRTCTPAGLGGDVGGAMSTTTLPMPPAPTAAATAGVLTLSTCAQVWPPLVEVKIPCPELPACSTRLPAGVEVSSTSERTSPEMPAPGVQLRPPSCERNTPLVDAR